MELIKTWEFRINKNTDDSTQKYPDLPFSMALQAGENTYSANVSFNIVNQNLQITIYDDSDNIIQPRINVGSNIDLFFIIGYSLIYNDELSRFEFYKG